MSISTELYTLQVCICNLHCTLRIQKYFIMQKSTVIVLSIDVLFFNFKFLFR